MAETIPRCVNHPDVETRISCSTCGNPICTRCMRQAAVGQKCPSCARVPLRARGVGRPIHYVRAAGAGLAVAAVGGVVLGLLLPIVRIGSLILSALLGFGVGRAVGWGAHRQTHRPFEVMAVGLGALGAVIAQTQAGRLGYGLFGILAAGYFGLRGLRG